jgi:flagellar biosynthetic protein FliP
MRTDAHAKSAGRATRIVSLLLLIVLSAKAPAFGEETSQGTAPSAPTPPTAVSGAGASGAATAAATESGTRIEIPSQAASAGRPFTIPTGAGGSGFTLPSIGNRENFSAAMQIIVVLTVLSLAPAILLMMTSFTRIVIVLSLLRQALGTQQLPPNQVMIGLAMFMTFLVMGPTWQRVNDEALRPYMDGNISQQAALERAKAPVREFMIAQIHKSGNDADVDLFSEFAHKDKPATWSEVDTTTLIPAFMLSELKTAFLLGFQVYLPFLVIDMVISIVLISMGMMMLPPALISLPFKLLLFVLVDGWHLITQSLMGSFVSG